MLPFPLVCPALRQYDGNSWRLDWACQRLDPGAKGAVEAKIMEADEGFQASWMTRATGSLPRPTLLGLLNIFITPLVDIQYNKAGPPYSKGLTIKGSTKGSSRGKGVGGGKRETMIIKSKNVWLNQFSVTKRSSQRTGTSWGGI